MRQNLLDRRFSTGRQAPRVPFVQHVVIELQSLVQISISRRFITVKIAGMMLLVFGIAGAAMAGGYYVAVPEIDAGSATTGLVLLSGALLVIKSRMKK